MAILIALLTTYLERSMYCLWVNIQPDIQSHLMISKIQITNKGTQHPHN